MKKEIICPYCKKKTVSFEMVNVCNFCKKAFIYESVVESLERGSTFSGEKVDGDLKLGRDILKNILKEDQND